MNSGAIRKIVSILLALVVFAATVELCARMDDHLRYDAPFWGSYHAERLRTVDSNGLQVNRPDVRYEKWYNNRHAFRGEDFEPTKKPEVRRIVCMGTSETYGLYESPDKEWPRQLAYALGNPDAYEVINASVVGLGVEHFQPYIDKYVLKFRPDDVVLLINPFFFAVSLERAIKRTATQKASADPPTVPQSSLEFTTFISTVIDYCRSLPKFKVAIKKVIPEALLRHYGRWKLDRQLAQIEALELADKSPLDQVPDNTVMQFKAALVQLTTYLKKNGINPVLCTYPVLLSSDTEDHYRLIFDGARLYFVEYSVKGLSDLASEINRTIRAVSDDQGLGFVDLDAAVPKDNDHFADLVHYTDKGAHAIAGLLAEYFSKSGPEDLTGACCR